MSHEEPAEHARHAEGRHPPHAGGHAPAGGGAPFDPKRTVAWAAGGAVALFLIFQWASLFRPPPPEDAGPPARVVPFELEPVAKRGDFAALLSPPREGTPGLSLPPVAPETEPDPLSGPMSQAAAKAAGSDTWEDWFPEARKAEARRGHYLNAGWWHGREEEEDLRDVVAFVNVYYAPQDGYPVVGDAVSATVDGKPAMIALKPSSSTPGARKAVVVLPRDGRMHTVVFMPLYDLGPDGQVPVRDTMSDDGYGHHAYRTESPVQTIDLRPGVNVPLKLKD